MKHTLLPTISSPCRWAMSIVSRIRGGSAKPNASWSAATPSLGLEMNDSGCQNSCSPLAARAPNPCKALISSRSRAARLEVHLL